ncbi:Aminopeptidase O [Mactra antiquata]
MDKYENKHTLNMDGQSKEHELDLPLFSNISEIHVLHYILDLRCCQEKKIFNGSVTVIFERVRESPQQSKTGDNDNVHDGKIDQNSQESSELPYITDQHFEVATNDSIVQNSDHDYCAQCSAQDAMETQGNTSTVIKPDSFVEPIYHEQCDEPNEFLVMLDAWDLNIDKVHSLYFESNMSYYDISHDKEKLNGILIKARSDTVKYCSEKKCLKMWIPEGKQDSQLPYVLRISYTTQPYGQSLKWTVDQDGRPCVYTHGHWINNRSLFPSQDVPGGLSTWSAHITVVDDLTVLMSGDYNAVVKETGISGYKTYFYETKMKVPSSTLALAIGHWECCEIISNDNIIDSLDSPDIIPCSLYCSTCKLELAETLLKNYIPRCMKAAFNLLGPHPFKRLNIVIVPSSFASLGMASLSLIFLSQSTLSADGHMLIRVAHEISHSWFGLVIGPSDWHEEWLSEGFCTFTESIIHSYADETPEKDFKLEQEIYDYLKYQTLTSELQSVSEDLQSLRHCSKDNSTQASDTKFVVNGVNPDKGFLQLHYLKGYFLLRYLEKKVGSYKFHQYLQLFVTTFNHMLIDSMDVLRLFFKMFPEKRTDDFCEEIIFQTWLNAPGVPKELNKPAMVDNIYEQETSNLEKTIIEANQTLLKLHWRKRQKLDICTMLVVPELKIVQILLLLDKLLQYNNIHHSILIHLNNGFQFSHSNADVRHKWCELVVKHKLLDCYHDVGNFLIADQAMGVYLFGELIISRNKEQRKLALECYKNIENDMEDGVKTIVKTMLFGS